ncbi:MAG: hypothetical protein U0798_10570 [Gemmataceae bacterium]
MIARIAILTMLLAVALMPPAQAQAQTQAPDQEPQVRVPPRLPNNGTDLFRGLLNFSSVEPVKRTNPKVPLNQQMVIVYGKPQTQEQLQNIASVIWDVSTNGGVVFIAISDPFDFQDLNFGDLKIIHTDLRFYSEYFVPEELTPAQRIYCPYASSRPFGLNQLTMVDPSPSWNPFRGLARIATYRPAVLTSRKPKNSPDNLAYLPPGCVSERRTGPKIPEDSQFAVFHQVGQGFARNAIIMADEHVLSNQMIAMSGTDNLPFALKLIAALKGNPGSGGNSPRSQAYFFEYGVQKNQFDDVKFNAKPSPTVPPIPIPPPQVLDKIGTQIANSMANQLDVNNAHNRLISQNESFYAQLMRVLIISLVVLASLYLIRRLFVSQYRKDRTALPSSPLARIKPAKGLVGQMRQDLLMHGDYGIMVRDYIRDLFLSLGLPAGSHHQLPNVNYSGKPENRPALLEDLHKLWAIAFDSAPRVTIADWKTLEPVLIRVWRAAEAGRWTFAATPENS